MQEVPRLFFLLLRLPVLVHLLLLLLLFPLNYGPYIFLDSALHSRRPSPDKAFHLHELCTFPRLQLRRNNPLPYIFVPRRVSDTSPSTVPSADNLMSCSDFRHRENDKALLTVQC